MALFPRRKSASADSDADDSPEGRGAIPLERPNRRRTVGQLLRQTRESYGSDLARVAAALRIRSAYLEAIEEGKYDRLPGPVYALGFVRAYAIHLGLDGDEAVRRFKLDAEGLEGQRDLSFPVPLAERSIPGGTMLLVALILAVCGYGLWYYLSTGTRPRPERVDAVPTQFAASAPAPAPAAERAPSDVPSAVSTATAAAVPAEPLPPASPPSPPASPAAAPEPPAAAPPPSAPVTAATPESASPNARTAPPPPPPPVADRPTQSAEVAPPRPPAPPAPPVATTAAPAPVPAVPTTPTASAANAPREYGIVNGETRIVIRAVGDAWIQVRDKGVPIFTNTLHPGETYRVPDRPGITMRTGNGTGLAFTVDGRPSPPIGGAFHRNVVLEPDRLLAGTAVAD